MTTTSRGRPADRPTDAELEILRVLWERGPCTVGQVQQALQAARPTGYTTALKLMQIMAGKGLLVRDEGRRPHVYCPRVAAEETQRTLVRDLLDRAFAGAADQLVMRALGAKEVSAGELARIRELLDEMEGKHR
jgi:BlaI family transcriptional regulator, penicillinase repressor